MDLDNLEDVNNRPPPKRSRVIEEYDDNDDEEDWEMLSAQPTNNRPRNQFPPIPSSHNAPPPRRNAQPKENESPSTTLRLPDDLLVDDGSVDRARGMGLNEKVDYLIVLVLELQKIVRTMITSEISKGDETWIVASVSGIVSRKPLTLPAEIFEILKQRNPVFKKKLTNDVLLSIKVNKLISEKVSYYKSYIKEKLFFDNLCKKPGDKNRCDAFLDDFVNYLFGGKDSFLDEELKNSAVLLRSFRDAQYKDYRSAKRENFFAENAPNFWELFGHLCERVSTNYEANLNRMTSKDLENFKK